MTLSQDGLWAATGGWFGSISLWDTDTGNLLRRFPKQPSAITAIALNANSKTLATVAEDDNRILLWDLRTGISTGTLSGHTGKVKSLVISPDGRFLVSGSEDQGIRIWNIKTQGLVKTLVR
jgi:WD40 repeat protein